MRRNCYSGYGSDTTEERLPVSSELTAEILLKYHSLIAVEQNPVFDMPANRARKHHFFDVAAFFDELFNSVPVRDSDHILFNDGPIVEYFGHIVSRRPNQLDSSLERLVIGPGANKSRKERVVNVDQVLRTDSRGEFSREHLHVAR